MSKKIIYAMAGVLSLSKYLSPNLTKEDFVLGWVSLIHLVGGGKHQPRRVIFYRTPATAENIFHPNLTKEDFVLGWVSLIHVVGGGKH